MEVFEYEIISNKGDDTSELTNPDETIFFSGKEHTKKTCYMEYYKVVIIT